MAGAIEPLELAPLSDVLFWKPLPPTLGKTLPSVPPMPVPVGLPGPSSWPLLGVDTPPSVPGAPDVPGAVLV